MPAYTRHSQHARMSDKDGDKWWLWTQLSTSWNSKYLGIYSTLKTISAFMWFEFWSRSILDWIQDFCVTWKTWNLEKWKKEREWSLRTVSEQAPVWNVHPGAQSFWNQCLVIISVLKCLHLPNRRIITSHLVWQHTSNSAAVASDRHVWPDHFTGVWKETVKFE